MDLLAKAFEKIGDGFAKEIEQSEDVQTARARFDDICMNLQRMGASREQLVQLEDVVSELCVALETGAFRAGVENSEIVIM